MSVNFTEFSEYMVGQHGDKIEKNPKLFYQLAQKYRGERMGMVLFSGLPNDFILKHSSLSEVLDFRREMSYRDDNYEREYDDIISKFFLFGDIDDSEIIKLLNTYTENNDSYTLYVLFKNLEAETIVRIRDDIDIFKGIKFDANGYATEEYANLTEIFDVFDNTFISGVDDYRGYLEGETIDIWDYDISDYQVDKIVDCIIKEDNSWKIKFKNYINNNSDYGDNIFGKL